MEDGSGREAIRAGKRKSEGTRRKFLCILMRHRIIT